MKTSLNYSVPNKSKKLLLDGLINNELHGSAPTEIKEAAKYIEYIGSSLPVVPINWRFAESISAIKGFQAAMINVLLKRKYNLPYQRVVINTDHAQLFFMSPFLPIIDPHGAKTTPSQTEEFEKYFRSCDIYNAYNTRTSAFDAGCTNIYKTKDSRYYHLHGSMNPRVCQDALDIPRGLDVSDIATAGKIYEEKITQFNSGDIEALMNDRYRQAGTTCLSTEEYKASPHGKANAHVGLYEIHHIINNRQKPSWWKPVEGLTNASRPLFGLKVIDLTRIIASPTIGRELAELGASVLRITSPNVTDMSPLNLDLGWGKWNAHLDLTKEADRLQLKTLIEESDVVIDGYRPGVMKKWGFGKEDILKMFEDKEKGIIYAHENCYGWNGPWAHRSGWQQISDAVCGVSLEFGRAMGNNEAVTPVFPNSDFCTGASGSIGIMQALMDRADRGGSYVVDVALNYYSQWLVNSCSVYPHEVWEYVWGMHARPVFRHMDNMRVTVPLLLKMLHEKAPILFNPEFFEDRENKALGVPVYTVKPILTFPEKAVHLGYNIGSRGNGVDKPKWPSNLLTEVIV